MYEEYLNQIVKVDYKIENGERFLRGTFVEQNETHIKILGLKDQKPFLILKTHVISLSIAKGENYG